MQKHFLWSLVCSSSLALSSSFLLRQAPIRSFTRVMSSSTREASGKSSTDNDNPPPLKSYFHLLVDENGGTSMTRREFVHTESVGYANTPQTVKELSDQFGEPTKVIFTALEGENPWHFCPAPQLVVCTGGGWYIRTNDNQVTEMRVGDVLYQDNVEGHPGAASYDDDDDDNHAGQHFSGSLDGKPCQQMIVQLELKNGPQISKAEDNPPI